MVSGMDMETADLDPDPRSTGADRFLLADIAELIRLGVPRRQFAETLREEGVPFSEVDLARLFRDARARRPAARRPADPP